MPTSTFFRLPEEKRTRLTDAAWEEFTRVRYTDASINKIIGKANIPRGSFYQYFADKDDLFRHMLTDTREYFLSGFAQILEEVGGDIFAFPLKVFDRYAAECTADPQVDRFVKMARLNVGMDLHSFFGDCQELRSCCIVKHLDHSRFRRQDPIFVEQVFGLLLICTASAVLETLARPEGREQQKAILRDRVDILAHGSLLP